MVIFHVCTDEFILVWKEIGFFHINRKYYSNSL